MLERLELHHVGPAPHLELTLASRLNLITGDNGLGKSFLLEVAWWALTRSWAGGHPARPQTGLAHEARIQFRPQGGPDVECRYDLPSQQWTHEPDLPTHASMVVYARVDGSFSIWDPARNAWPAAARRHPSLVIHDRPTAYHFEPAEVWDGIDHGGVWLCNGLIRDWASWQGRQDRSFHALQRALKTLSPDDGDPLDVGPTIRINLDDVRDIPTLKTFYDPEMPVVHASAAVKRILVLAYLLVWTWQEHTQASRLLQQQPTRRIVFLIDELESHLHPRWQRTILRSLLAVMSTLTGSDDLAVQLLAVTHSPLLLASVEPLFDPARDALWNLDVVDGHVQLRHEPWRRRGDANTWLVSDIFHIHEPRSLEAEQAIRAAEQLMRQDSAPTDQISTVRTALMATLPDVDPFWVRWRFWLRKAGAAP